VNKLKKNSPLAVLVKGLILENPVFVLVLGTCPTLATTNSVKGALSMGIAAMLVLICSNFVISLLRKLIPETVRIPCYIVIIAGFVTIVQMLMQGFLPELYKILGIYLALITVNCIILGRAEMYASKNNPLMSALDGLGMGLGFTFALLVMSFIREVFGNASFFDMPIAFLEPYKIEFLTKAPGGFFVFGVVIAVINAISHGRAVKRKSFGCEGCPSQGSCSGGCSENSDSSEEVSENGNA
jgi:electron transport complex protein RnfE